MVKPHFLQCDFHTHTEYSGEGQAKGFTVEKVFETAERLGLRCVACSEHWHVNTSPDLFRRIRDEVQSLQPRFNVRVFVSAEIDCLNSAGDLACDPAEAAGILDYVSVAVSHHHARGAEQLLPDLVDDTAAMIKAVCHIPEVTMIMHPQIVYGRCLDRIDRVVAPEVYADAIACVVESGKVVHYPSVQMSFDFFERLGYPPEKVAIARRSWAHFTQALVAQKALLAPGSDAHHVLWPGSDVPWLGNNKASWQLLKAHGFRDEQLWIPGG